jgi:quercetin dioxygenase-like cupin family protein
MTLRQGNPSQDFMEELLDDGVHPDELALCAELAIPTPPPSSIRTRLLLSLEGGGRLHRFAARIAELLDTSEARAAELLDAIDEPASWEKAMWPGVELFHVPGGPRVEAAITGFVRVARGGVFPHHTHLGEETVFIVQGSCRDTHSGQVLRPGDVCVAGIGNPHVVEAMPGPTLVYLAVVFGGVDVGGVHLLPGDPRI